MENPRKSIEFESDHIICDGEVATMLDTIMCRLIIDDEGNARVLTAFGSQLLGLVREALDLVSQRTRECEKLMMQYELTARLEEIKEEEKKLRDEYNDKKRRLDELCGEKEPQAQNPEHN